MELIHQCHRNISNLSILIPHCARTNQREAKQRKKKFNHGTVAKKNNCKYRIVNRDPVLCNLFWISRYLLIRR